VQNKPKISYSQNFSFIFCDQFQMLTLVLVKNDSPAQFFIAVWCYQVNFEYFFQYWER
jgi:hypothetical protein